MNLIETIYGEVEEDNYGKLGKGVELGDRGLDEGILNKLIEKNIISKETMDSLVYIFEFDYKKVVSFVHFILKTTKIENLENVILGYMETYIESKHTKDLTSKVLARFGEFN